MALINCPLCGQRDERFLLTGTDHLLGIEGEFTLVQCQQCELIYLNPQPSLATLVRYYPEATYGRPIQTVIKQGASPHSVKGWLLKRLLLLSQDARIRAIERLQPLEPSVQLLDVGCGSGVFLSALRQTNAVAGIGVEMSRQKAAFCQTQLGLDVRPGPFLDTLLPDHTFDVVTMFHYFEHEIHPLPALQKTRRLLTEKGLLVIELPNIGSPLFTVFKSAWFCLDIPRHVVHYSASTLANMLRRAGFEVVAIEYRYRAAIVGSLAYLFGGRRLSRWRQSRPRISVLLLLCLSFPLWPVVWTVGMGLSLFRASDVMTVYARPILSEK